MTGLEQYKRALFSCLSCSTEEKEYFFSHISQSVEADEKGKLSYEELVSAFGSPENVAAAYIEQKPATDFITEVRQIKGRSRQIKIIVLLIATLILGFLIYYVVWNNNTKGGHGEAGDISIVSTIFNSEQKEGQIP